ncbi:MAG: cupin domain-containing protein [Sphingomonadaceae bacterium]|nr:cupin domain-containing protein [Sphingomonadaceae bacterium]
MTHWKFAALWLGMVACVQAHATPPTRTPIATIPIDPAKEVDRVEATRVDFLPGQIMPMHKHTVPVICFVTAGSFLVKIGDGRERPARVGDVTYEPANTVVNYFQNASATAPGQLMCALLANKRDTVLNVMLDHPRAH